MEQSTTWISLVLQPQALQKEMSLATKKFVQSDQIQYSTIVKKLLHIIYHNILKYIHNHVMAVLRGFYSEFSSTIFPPQHLLCG